MAQALDKSNGVVCGNFIVRDQDERFRLSNKMNDIAKNVNTEKAIYGKDVEEAERVINDLGEFVRNGIIPLPLREVQF